MDKIDRMPLEHFAAESSTTIGSSKRSIYLTSFRDKVVPALRVRKVRSNIRINLIHDLLVVSVYTILPLFIFN